MLLRIGDRLCRRMTFRGHFWIAVIWAVLAGCTPDPNAEFELYPVQGKISWTDGRPLPEKLALTLQSMDERNLQAIASVKSDGKFSNVIFLGIGGDGRPGTVAGKHKLILKVPIPIGEEAVNMTPAQRQAVAVQARLFEPYSTFQKSPLIVEIGPDRQDLIIELDASPVGSAGKPAGDAKP